MKLFRNSARPGAEAPRIGNAPRLLALLLCWLMATSPLAGVLRAQSADAKPKMRIAVLDFKLVNVESSTGVVMIDRLRSDLVNTQRFTVLDRAQSDKIMEELARQQSGLSDEKTAIEIGKQFNVSRIVTGRVAFLKDLQIIQVNAEMIDMKSAQIILSETITHDGDMRSFILQRVPELAVMLAGVAESGDAVAKRPPPDLKKLARALPPPRPTPQQPQVEQDEGGGMPWWIWVVGGVVLLGLAAAGGGSDAPPAPPTGAVGSVDVTW